MLQVLGVWDKLSPLAQNMTDIIVTDSNATEKKPSLLSFSTGDKTQAPAALIENAHIFKALLAAIDESPSIDILAAYIFIQFIDNHYISPKVVASKVKINALISIIVVLSGGALWGIPGMFLSIPLTAIVKVICDHIEPLKPWGFLLGDTMPTIAVFRLKSKVNTK